MFYYRQIAASNCLPLTLPLRGGFRLPGMSDTATSLHIDLLYFEGCPSCERTQADLTEVLAAADLDATVRLVEVQASEQADTLRFAGSPMVKVNGVDLEGYDGPGVLACRVYRENGGKGWPSRALLERALAAAKTSMEAC